MLLLFSGAPLSRPRALGPPFETACGVRAVSFTPDLASIVLVTQRWVHFYTLEGRPIASRWLPSQFAGSLRFPDDCAGCLELALTDPCLPLRLFRLRQDLEDVAPARGEPSALLGKWTRRLTGRPLSRPR